LQAPRGGLSFQARINADTSAQEQETNCNAQLTKNQGIFGTFLSVIRPSAAGGIAGIESGNGQMKKEPQKTRPAKSGDSASIGRRAALKRIALATIGVAAGTVFAVTPREASAGNGVNGDYTDSGGYGVSGDYTDKGGYSVSGDYTDSGGYGVSGDYTDSGGYGVSGDYTDSHGYSVSGDYTDSN
jgi:hypothetical protein